MKQIIFLVSILFVVSAYAQDSSVVNTKEIIDRMNKMDNPSLFSRSQFIEETSKFLEKVYGFHPASYQCALWMLADQMQIYMSPPY